MKCLALAATALVALAASASAQVIPPGTNPVPAGGAYNSSPPALTSGQAGWLQLDSSGNLRVSGTVTTSLAGSTSNATSGVATSATNIPTVAYNYWFNGVTWDQALGDATNGAFVNVKTSVLPTLASTSTKQSDGSQKSQIVDGSGNVAGQTANAVDVNIKSGSSGLPSGASTAANQTSVQAPVAPATATATKSELIGCQATTAAVNPTTGQQGAVSCDTNNNILTSQGGAPNLAIAQVSIATSDTAAVAARALRRAVTIQQITGTQQVYCNQTTATIANGVLLPAVVGASITLNTTSAVRCIAVTGAQTVAIMETF